MSGLNVLTLDSIATHTAAAGTDLASATLLTANYSIVDGGTTGQGVKLDKNLKLGDHQIVEFQSGVNILNIFPPDASSNLVWNGVDSGAGVPSNMGGFSVSPKGIKYTRANSLTWYGIDLWVMPVF